MDERRDPGYDEGKATRPQQPFRFAGVELRAEDTPQDKLRDLTKADFAKNAIISLVVGAGFTFVCVWLEQSFNDRGTLISNLSYPYFSHGLLFFYIGWAMYWGIRDCLNADMMGEQHSVNSFAASIFRWTREIQLSFGALGVYAMVILVSVALIVYNLIGGGVYGFYKLLRESKGSK